MLGQIPLSGVGIHDSSGTHYFASSLTTSAARSRPPRITRMAVPKVNVVNQRREFLEHALDFQARVPHVQVLHPGDLRHRSTPESSTIRSSLWCDSRCRGRFGTRLVRRSSNFTGSTRSGEGSQTHGGSAEPRPAPSCHGRPAWPPTDAAPPGAPISRCADRGPRGTGRGRRGAFACTRLHATRGGA